MLYSTVLQCGVPEYTAWKRAVLCCRALCGNVLCCAVLCCAVLCCAVLRFALLCCMLTRLTPHGRSSLSCGVLDIVFCVVCDMFQLPSLYLSQAPHATN
jgi:uncharacterized membrane protein YeiB